MINTEDTAGVNFPLYAKIVYTLVKWDGSSFEKGRWLTKLGWGAGMEREKEREISDHLSLSFCH